MLARIIVFPIPHPPMPDVALWSLIAGTLFMLMALAGSSLKHLPLSTAIFYLPVGMLIGPTVLGLSHFDPIKDAALIEHLTEMVVTISLFTVGLKLNVPLRDPAWRLPLRLAVGSMVLTVGAIALIGWAWLGLPLGAAVLLGAILAPTDPVLASDVQVSDAEDRDRLRVALTGEGGMNDGTAFPFVMLGLGLLGLHPLGSWAWRWWVIDVAWAVIAGLAIGATLGTLVGRMVLWLRRHYQQAVGYDDFLALGLVALSYGAALSTTGYGFLAVFAAGLALRRVERNDWRASKHRRAAGQRVSAPVPPTGELIEQALRAPEPPIDPNHIATHPDYAPAFMTHAILGSNEQIERIGEVTAVVLVGAMLWAVDWSLIQWWFVPAVFVLVRPIAVAIGLIGSRTPPLQRRLIGWFGVRGIGSLYYLAYAITHGLDGAVAKTLAAIVLSAVVASIIVHGVSVTPLMHLYARRIEARRARRAERERARAQSNS